MTISVDFDAPIRRCSRGWADGTIYDPPTTGALEALSRLMAVDDSCKVCGGCGDGPELDLPPRPPWECEVCERTDQITFWTERGRLLVTSRKPPATAYVDDRAVAFTNSCPEAQAGVAAPSPRLDLGATAPPA
ncbi:hypothetical protein [Nonomuraea sp. NPDC050310]|uniref:hypothetical protein n=1 Tax=Nonomuraea sp. NPDC050310 TaxID=3154935 RepID=UPI0033DE57E1